MFVLAHNNDNNNNISDGCALEISLSFRTVSCRVVVVVD